MTCVDLIVLTINVGHTGFIAGPITFRVREPVKPWPPPDWATTALGAGLQFAGCIAIIADHQFDGGIPDRSRRLVFVRMGE